MLSGFGWLANLIIYLVQEFNVESINATQIANVVHGCINLLPVLGAIIADSFLGSFHVAAISSFISMLVNLILLYISFFLILAGQVTSLVKFKLFFFRG